MRPEHFIHGCPELLRHFHILFNGLIQHGFVPTNFLKGTISPIVKDTQGDVSDVNNYRGITLSSLPAKLFEYAVQKKTSHLLGTDDLQFGFKKRTSTSHALFTLKSTVEYFNERGSQVYVAFLDCSKAFDRISHYGLFIKLIERNVPLCILMCLVFWYLNMSCVVKWDTELSRSFPVPLGVKQGGINSPEFFSCYLDGLVKLLRDKGIGCHAYKFFLAIILFADDMCLLAPTRSALSTMMSYCSDYCSKLGLSFNPKKSKIMFFSKNHTCLDGLKPVLLNGKEIEYVSSIRYLGTTIVSGPGFTFSSADDLLSFYRSANSILNVLQKPADEVLMQLLYTNCVPTLTYACSVKEYPSAQMQECTVALNDAIQKIFTYERWESVRRLRMSAGYKSLSEIFALQSRNFHRGLTAHCNFTLRRLAFYVI